MTGPSASRLVTLTASVVALIAAVGITGGKRGMVERPLIAPGLNIADVTRIEILHAGAPPIVIAIDDQGIRVDAPAPGPADEAVVRDLLSAVVTARADHVVHAKVAALASPDLRVRIVRRSQPPIVIARGAAVPSSGQRWLDVDGRAVLVPGWVGAALDRDLTTLRIRRVFPPGPITGVEFHDPGYRIDVVLSGNPLHRRDAGSSVRISSRRFAELERALSAVTIDVFVTGNTGESVLTVRVLGGAAPHELVVNGACPGHLTHWLVSGSAGTGCVRNEIIRELRNAAQALTYPGSAEWVLAPAAGADIESITDGKTTLVRRGAGWLLMLGGERVDADDDAVSAFFQSLPEARTLLRSPTGAPIATWNVTLTGGSVETWRWFAYGQHEALVVRDEEPMALVLPSRAALDRFGPPLRNLSLLVIDGSTINAIRATGANPASLARGQLVGEWNPPASPAVATIVDMLATFRGLQWLEPRELGAIRRTLTFSIDAPPIPGEPPTTHTIAIGAARPAGRCAARVDAHLPIELSAAQCAALLAPLAQ